jgi:2-polyprenyl-3-methyl-5-hydroxy-6-metoxy-1,4-benzoquinol methylase
LKSVADHYERLLADHYTWMTGSFAGKVAEQKALLSELGVIPGRSGRALDLGCGSGFQSVALAELGFAVTALDGSAKLLAELETHKGSLPIVPMQADIAAGLGEVSPDLDVIVCMGDTLTHLESKDAVTQLFTQARALLAPGGRLVLSFRDLTAELAGIDRFILVRADAERIMTCFLEYRPETVLVHDLIHIREGEGWTLQKSCYPKLRLGTRWVTAELAALDFRSIWTEKKGGLTIVRAEG